MKEIFSAHVPQLLNIPEDPRQQQPLKRLLAGGMAGITSVTATYPLDLVRTRLSAQGEGKDRKYKSVLKLLKLYKLTESDAYWLCRVSTRHVTCCGY